MTELVPTAEILHMQQQTIQDWHSDETSEYPCDGLTAVACRQHRFNFDLWHEEDKARDKNADNSVIADVKRRIDTLNQQRNDWIEKIDDRLIEIFSAADIRPEKDAPLNTETPGSVFDRLSILHLRIFHMEEQAERKDANQTHRETVHARLKILRTQLADLSSALRTLLSEIASGKRRIKVYRQFKMYNDPAMNPYLSEA